MRTLLWQTLPFYSMSDGGGGGDFNNGIRRIEAPLDQRDEDTDALDYDPNPERTQRRESDPRRDRLDRGRDEISLDPNEVLNTLFGDEEEDDELADDDPDNQRDRTRDRDGDRDRRDDQDRGRDRTRDSRDRQRTGDPEPDAANAAEAERLAKEFKTEVDRFDIPETDIPADFDVSDRNQLRKLLVTTQRKTISQTVQLAMGIVQKAMASDNKRTMAEIDRRIGATQTKSRTEAALEAAIPEYRDKAMRTVIRTIFDQAALRHRKTPDAINATKLAIKALGGKFGGGGSADGDSQDRTRRTSRSGESSNIDSFFDQPLDDRERDSRRTPAQRRMQRR